MVRKLNFLLLVFTFSLAIKSLGQTGIKPNLTFIQGDSLYKTNKNSNSILLERKPFFLRYFGKKYDGKNEKYYAAQIAVLENPNDTLNLKIGTNTKDFSFFEPGTGMAPGYNNMYDTLVITNSGHHFLTYENEKDKRVFLISKNKEILELEWRISAASYNEKDFQFADLKLNTLYFVVLQDYNFNEIIDNGELKIITINFK